MLGSVTGNRFSAADVNIGSLTLFPAPLHRLLFMNSAGVKEREVINPSSQLDAVSKVRA